MNKKILCLLAMLLMLSSIGICAEKKTTEQPSELDKETIYYPDANIQSAVAKYKNGNYTGCLQELFSLTKKDPSNALAYYYMAMAYTHIDMQNDAVEAYEKVISLSPNSYLADYAAKGKDCLTGGPACIAAEAASAVSGATEENQDDLDKFINAPYGNGLSPELNKEIQQQKLNRVKETINKKENLDYSDIEKLKKINEEEDNTSSIAEPEKIASVSDEEILQAVKTLKDAGLNVTIQQDYSQYQDPQLTEMSMMLGGYNNNSNNSMMNMLPMLMTKAQNGENVDPRFMQAMMMNSMLSDLNFNNNNNNRY